MKQRPIRVLCVDDHSFIIEGLLARFELERDLECVGALADAGRLLEQAKQLKPDIVLLDIEMPGPDPFEAADDLRRHCPETRTVFLSAYVRDHYISAAVKSGAWGYFSKSEDTDTIIEGIRQVSDGQFCFSPKVQERCQPAKAGKRGKLEPPPSKLDTLTPREQEVLRMIGKGLSRAEIAYVLQIPESVVKSRLFEGLKKLRDHTSLLDDH